MLAYYGETMAESDFVLDDPEYSYRQVSLDLGGVSEGWERLLEDGHLEKVRGRDVFQLSGDARWMAQTSYDHFLESNHRTITDYIHGFSERDRTALMDSREELGFSNA